MTAERRGGGWLILMHTTANADWSNLPLSGLFVTMLRRIVALSQGVGGSSERPMPPYALLDGFGTLGGPVSGTEPLPATASRAELGMPAVGPRHPPGFYGDDSAREALNLGPSLDGALLASGVPDGAARQPLEAGRDTELQGWAFALALLLAILDTLIGLALRGLLTGRLTGAAWTRCRGAPARRPSPDAHRLATPSRRSSSRRIPRPSPCRPRPRCGSPMC